MNESLPSNNSPKNVEKNFLKTLLVLFLGLIGFAYLLNPTAGIFELIPDAIPIIGNLDEAVAVTLILSCLRYFGYDFTKGFSRSNKK